ncbi:MAG: transglutaminase family protein, partial [Dinoroseobacter sp.]|nr:transglutaminase family protein [Dinoroseobacter sp.]
MRMKIKHVTSYHYEEPVSYALQQLRLTPKTRPGQKVISWTTSVEGGTLQVAFDDEHFNQVQLISFESDV